jgi:hypothetical protein
MRDQGIVSGITLRDFALSFYLRSRAFRVACMGLLVAAAAGSCQRSSQPSGTSPSEPARARLRGDLAWLPDDAGLVVAVDFDRLRALPVGKTLLANPADPLVRLDDWLRAVGLGGIGGTRRLLVALPAERQADDRMLVVATGLAPDRARAQAWSNQHKTGATVARIDDGRLLIGGGAWTTAVSAARPPASGDAQAVRNELAHLCERAAERHPAWMAAVVPTALRTASAVTAGFADVAAITRGWAGIAVDAAVNLDARVELSNQPDARSLANRLDGLVKQAQRHPDMLALGLAPHLESLRLSARGPGVDASLTIPADQATDVLARMDQMARGHSERWLSVPGSGRAAAPRQDPTLTVP